MLTLGKIRHETENTGVPRSERQSQLWRGKDCRSMKRLILEDTPSLVRQLLFASIVGEAVDQMLVWWPTEERVDSCFYWIFKSLETNKANLVIQTVIIDIDGLSICYCMLAFEASENTF